MTVCSTLGCRRTATCTPMVCVPAMGRSPGHRRLETVIPIPTCGNCHAYAADCALDMFEGDTPAGAFLREKVALSAGGRFLPDFDRAWVEALPLTSQRWAQTQLAAAGRLN